MNAFIYANDINIRRFEDLLESSTDENERKIIQVLLAEEKARMELQASEPNRK